MKFRELKKKKFVILFDSFEVNCNGYTSDHYSVVIYKGDKLEGTAEYDSNDLNTTEYTYDIKVTWKDLKHNMKHYKLRIQTTNRKPYSVYLFTGKCSECNIPIDYDEFKRFGTCYNCYKKSWLTD